MKRANLTSDRAKAWDFIQTMAHLYVVPVLFLENARVTDNATATLLFPDNPIAVTNFHVLQAFREKSSECPSLSLALGEVRIDLEERLLDEDSHLDLATLRVEKGELAEMGKFALVPQEFTAVRSDIKSILVAAGYPQAYRTQEDNTIHIGGISIGEYALDNTDPRKILLHCDKSEWLVGSGRRDPAALEKWGGFSGGGLFYHDSTEPIVPLKAVGIITGRYDSYGNNTMTLEARPSTIISAAGRITRLPL